MDTINHLLQGFGVALQPINLIYCFIGVFIGTLVGVLPGIGPVSAMSLLLPVTLSGTPESGIIMMAGIYYGCMYGGSTTSILVNIPGEAASVVTCLDGHEMAKRGRAGPALAVAALKQERIRKIVLVRPAVEAGESLGYLPGDLQAKINPYLRPLLDALREMMDYDQIKRYTEQDLIEVIPLAYMRGRTLNEAFIILDEAQNTTVSQMKMFLTRMGRGSKIVVSGDTTQVDLPSHMQSGLVDATRRLRGIEGLTQVQLTDADIVRHRLVRDIVRAYEEEPRQRRNTANSPPHERER